MIAPTKVLIFGISGGSGVPIATDANGTVHVSPPTDSGGNVAFIDTLPNDIFNGKFALTTASALYGFNDAGTAMEPINSTNSTSDAQPALFAGQLSANSYLYGFNGATFDRIVSGAANADGLAPTALGNLLSIAQLFGWNGVSYQRVRLSAVFKSVAATVAGNTTVWTPAAGKKFRLMGYTISVAGTLAATGVELIKLTDAAAGTVIAQHNATVTITTPTGDTQIGADLGQGFLSGAINNALTVNLGTAMATGSVIVNAWGTEE